MLRFETFLLADEQFLVSRSLVSADRTYKLAILRHPALRLYGERIIYND
jgi:hypothetical protein